MAECMTAGQLERFAAAHRRVTRGEEAARQRQRLTWRVNDDGALTITATLPPQDGAAAITEEAPGAEDPAGPPPGVSAETPARMAAAAGQPRWPLTHPAREDRCHLEDGPAISPSALQLIGCNATISTMVHDADGTILAAGRRTRTPPPALRRAVRERDRYRCRFPGCESRKTDLHHVQHWSNGGPTTLANLTSLCRRHHAAVHAKGYTITTTGEFRTPGGALIPHSPQFPHAGGDITTTSHDADITYHTIIPPHSGERLNLHEAIWVSFVQAEASAARRGQLQQAC
jgi:5-methylcytosine-specific restriction endonuclease McrA